MILYWYCWTYLSCKPRANKVWTSSGDSLIWISSIDHLTNKCVSLNHSFNHCIGQPGRSTPVLIKIQFAQLKAVMQMFKNYHTKLTVCLSHPKLAFTTWCWYWQTDWQGTLHQLLRKKKYFKFIRIQYYCVTHISKKDHFFIVCLSHNVMFHGTLLFSKSLLCEKKFN